VTDLGDLAAWASAWDVVRAAATNQGQPCVGPHCDRCFGRRWCPEYLLPPEAAKGDLAPLAREGLALSNAEALAASLAIARGKELLKVAEEQLKAHVRAAGPILDEKGRTWGPCQRAGRRTLDAGKLEGALGSLAPFMKEGEPYEVWQWSAAPKGRKEGSK